MFPFSYFLIFPTRFAVSCFSRAFGNECLLVVRICIGFDLYRTVIGLENVPISQPIRSESKTNCGSLTHVFPRLAPGTCIFFRFWLVHWIVRVCSYWPEWWLTDRLTVWMFVYERVSKQTNKQTNDLHMCIFLATHMIQRCKLSRYNCATPQITAIKNITRSSNTAICPPEGPVWESAWRSLYTW